MQGAPNANSGLAFDLQGAPVVVGGATTFGPKTLWRPLRGSANLWEKSLDVPEGQGLLLTAPDRTLYYASSDIYQLTDDAAFTWTALGARTDFSAIGVDGTGAFYSISTNTGISRWRPGEAETVLPGSESTSSVAWGELVVDSTGTVYGSSGGGNMGIQRFTPTGASPAFDCNVPELQYCQRSFNFLELDAADNLYFLGCALFGQGAVYRVRKGTISAEKLADLPTEHTFCVNTQMTSDGTLYLQAQFDNLIDSKTGLYRLKAGDDTFELIAGPDVVHAGLVYVPRDSSTIFGYGGGHFGLGVVRGTL